MLCRNWLGALLLIVNVSCGPSERSHVAAAGSGWSRFQTDFNDGSWVGTVDPTTNQNNPVHSFTLEADQPSILISRPEYLLSWNSSTRIINWASWILEDGNVGKTDRSGFKRDEELNDFLAPSGQKAVDTDEYIGTCFDRGHQVPSKDRTQKFSQNQAVFKMSNMMPQTAFLNRIIWERLESHTRTLLKKKPMDRFWIVVGPIFKDKYRFTGIRKNIAIPDANFKIVIDLGTGARSVPQLVASVIMPNVTSNGSDPVKDRAAMCLEERNLPSMDVNWQDYTVTIEEIEREAKIDLSQLRGILN